MPRSRPLVEHIGAGDENDGEIMENMADDDLLSICELR